MVLTAEVQTVGHRRPLRICGIAINTLVILGKILLLRDEEGLRRGIHGRTGEVRSPLQAPAILEPIWLRIFLPQEKTFVSCVSESFCQMGRSPETLFFFKEKNQNEQGRVR